MCQHCQYQAKNDDSVPLKLRFEGKRDGREHDIDENRCEDDRADCIKKQRCGLPPVQAFRDRAPRDQQICQPERVLPKIWAPECGRHPFAAIGRKERIGGEQERAETDHAKGQTDIRKARARAAQHVPHEDADGEKRQLGQQRCRIAGLAAAQVQPLDRRAVYIEFQEDAEFQLQAEFPRIGAVVTHYNSKKNLAEQVRGDHAEKHALPEGELIEDPLDMGHQRFPVEGGTCRGDDGGRPDQPGQELDGGEEIGQRPEHMDRVEEGIGIGHARTPPVRVDRRARSAQRPPVLSVDRPRLHCDKYPFSRQISAPPLDYSLVRNWVGG